MTTGKIIKRLRTEKELTQKELADKLGVTRGSIGLYEQEKRSPDNEMLTKLANFFNVSTDYLLGLTDKRQTPNNKVKSAISKDPQLVEFWEELEKREDLQLLFKQTRDLSPETIQRVIKIIKIFEDEEKERHGG